MELRPGQIWWAAPETAVGREQAGRRPVLVIANEEYLAAVTTLALVVPITSTDRAWPNHVPLTGGHGLVRRSFAMAEQVRVISRRRMVQHAGDVDVATLATVRRWVIDFVTA